MAKPRIAIVATSHDKLGGTGDKTGFHYEELTTPYYVFADNGAEVTLGSIAGGKPAVARRRLGDRLGHGLDVVRLDDVRQSLQDPLVGLPFVMAMPHGIAMGHVLGRIGQHLTELKRIIERRLDRHDRLAL